MEIINIIISVLVCFFVISSIFISVGSLVFILYLVGRYLYNFFFVKREEYPASSYISEEDFLKKCHYVEQRLRGNFRKRVFKVN
jgi:hypothetical protein